MAYTFDGSSQYLEYASLVVSGAPATFAGEFYLVNTGDDPFLFSMYPSGTGSNFWGLQHIATQGWRAFANLSLEGCYRLVGSNSSTGWHCIAGSWTNFTTAPGLCVDGAVVTGTTNAGKGTLTVNLSGIGRVRSGGVYYYRRFYAADVVIYSAKLVDQDSQSLTNRFSPLLVRPQSIASYYPFGGAFALDTRDYVSGKNMTAYNTPGTTTHPRTIYPCDCCCA